MLTGKRLLPRTVIPAVLLAALAWGPATAARDREGTKAAFAQADEKEQALRQVPPEQRRQADYESIIGLYRKVPWLDPGAGECDNALLRTSLLRREGGKRFNQPRWIERAIESLDWLLKEYPYSPLQREALKLKGDILSEDLNRPDEARAVYEAYLKRYPRHASTLEVSRKLKALKTAETGPAPPREGGPAGKPPRLTDIRFWSTSDYTRVILDFDGRVTYTHDAAYNPYRIFFDFDPAVLGPDTKERIAPPDDIYLSGIRAALYKPEVVRVVLDFKKAGSYTVFSLPNTNSVVIDIRDPEQSAMVLERRKKLAQVFQGGGRPIGSGIEVRDLPPPPRRSGSGKKPAAASPAVPPTTPQPTPPPPAATAPVTPPSRPVSTPPAAGGPDVKPPGAPPPERIDVATLSRVMRLKIGKIVIDPGHGGKDTGSIGYDGLLEKDVVLAIARELKRQIEATLEIEVVLTRDADVFIPLEQRTARVNTEKADLFISLHANASRDRKVGGLETFFLGFSRDRAALMLAAYENATTEKGLGDLSDVIRKITQYEKMKESRLFARKMHHHLCKALRPLDPAARDRGVKTAPFVVLIGTNVPSVLLEIGFISNQKEAAFISDPANQAKVSAAIVEGIRDYLAGFEIRAQKP
ncbi:MAG: N-acetylmuramoyl-L-alanine amidase [Acidobacteria bacterium]|nr:N-acetylmuramoyl-L-alanine amidase [Acidobacteriota bacterium]